jgi:transposase
MDFERTTMMQFSEIQRLIEIGQTNRQIARILKCRRTLIAEVRRGTVSGELIAAAKKQETKTPPSWALRLDWTSIEKDIRGGHGIKQIWEESASTLTSHPNFFKYVKQRFALLLEATVTLREFHAGEHCEVDYAGDKIEWLDVRTGEIHKAHIFLGILCFSQKIFAWAAVDEKKANWLDSHRRMLEFYGGTPRVLVCDNLKTGVIKAHRYDPDLNQDYVEIAKHYGFAVVPARSKSPKDKAFVEGSVKIVMRYLRFVYRRRTFTSIAEINEAIKESLVKINGKIHTRFKVSRESRFIELEKTTLRPLPIDPFENAEWRNHSVHPDCTVHADQNFYSAPHIHRHKDVRVKISATRVEIFLDLERIAVHARARGKVGERIIDPQHLTENSRAYLEATPQTVLAHAMFSHPSLHALIDGMFKEDTLGQLRRAQGLTRKAYAIIQKHGREKSRSWIENAVAQMSRFGRIRVQYFEELLKAEMRKVTVSQVDRTIVRKPGNPMVRGHGVPKPKGDSTNAPQLTLI